MVKQCIQCGTIYNFKESKTDECWICGAPLEDPLEDIKQKDLEEEDEL